MKNKIIEISKMNEVTGRSSIKIAMHEIYDSNEVYNKNGISWSETYTENNLDSCIGMPICVSFIDDANTIPSGHGEFEVLDDGTVTFGTSSVVVGSIEKAYIGNIEIDGTIKKVAIAEGYLFSQRYTSFVDWLKETINSEQITTSIEIGAKAPNTEIIYDGGYKTKGRVPQDYCYTATAILYIVEPADDSAIVIEVNKNINNEVNVELKNKKRTIKGQTFEMNALNYYDICSIITKAFNKIMNPTCSNWCWDYCIHKFYPTESYVIMCKYDDAGEYWKTPYTITNGDITLGDITEVEEDWKPTNEVQEMQIDLSSLKEDFINKEENVCKQQENNSNKGGNNEMDETKIQELNSKIDELSNKVTELNSTVVEANKALETEKNEKIAMVEELNSLKVFKEEKDLEAKKAEINSYFTTEVLKNGFTEIEINSLKTDYVDKMDLDGLKKIEAELCVKKVKELNSIQKNVEVNSKDNSDLFMAIHNTEKSDEDMSDLF